MSQRTVALAALLLATLIVLLVIVESALFRY